MRGIIGWNPSAILLSILSFSLLMVNFGLQRENGRLNGVLGEVERARGPQPGVEIPELTGTRLSGEPINVKFGDRTLLLLFSAVCRACSENWPSWKELIRSKPSGIPLIYADATDLVSEHYMEKYMIPRGLLITKIELSTRWQYDLRETPQTIIIGRGGKVEKVWKGRMTPQDVKAATSALLN